MDYEKLETIRRIALVFFCFLAGTYLFAWLLWKNEIATDVTQFITHTITIPLYAVGTAVIMSSSARNIGTENPEKKPVLIAILILTIAVFFGLLLLDIFSRA